jgi:hypothetical protein
LGGIAAVDLAQAGLCAFSALALRDLVVQAP